jgi:hypothetical protein
VTDEPQPIRPTTDGLTLESRVTELEATVQAMTTELRTRRLVVTDDQDRPRVVTEIGHHAELRVEVPSDDGHRTAAVLYASLATDDEEPSIGVSLQADGNAEVELSIARHASGRWWIPNFHFKTRVSDDS